MMASVMMRWAQKHRLLVWMFLSRMLQVNINCHDFQILEETDILFPDDELDILDLDEDELLFEVGQTLKQMLKE